MTPLSFLMRKGNISGLGAFAIFCALYFNLTRLFFFCRKSERQL